MLGILVGITDGCYERSFLKIRNGLIGGLIGGFIAGILFGPIAWLINSPTGMSSRATGFVILGLCIGALVGFVHVVTKQAWISVIDGFRPGRQFVITQDVIFLGRAEFAALPFMGASNKEIEPQHAKIIRKPTGEYLLEDNNSAIGTILNSQKISTATRLADKDIIKIGRNYVQFRVKTSNSRSDESAGHPNQMAPTPKKPPPPPRKNGKGVSSSNNKKTVKDPVPSKKKMEGGHSASSTRRPPPPPRKK